MSQKESPIEEVKIVTKEECLHGYEFYLREWGYVLHPETIPEKIRHLKEGGSCHREIKTLCDEEVIIVVLEHGERRVAAYQSVPDSYSFFILIKNIGVVFTKENPVTFNFKQSTGWVLENVSLLEKNDDYVLFELVAIDMGGFGWREKRIIKVWLKHEWTNIIRAAVESCLFGPSDKIYDILYKKIDDSKFMVWIKDESGGIAYSVTLDGTTEDIILSLCERIMQADLGAGRSIREYQWPYATFKNPYKSDDTAYLLD